MRTYLWGGIPLLLGLHGCASLDEGAREATIALNEAADKRRAAEIHGECLALGFTENTDAFANCQLQIKLADQQSFSAARSRDTQERRHTQEMLRSTQ